MSGTSEITGFFSKEHKLLVFLICLCLYGLWTVHTQQQEMLSEIKLINYRLDGGKKRADTDKMAKSDLSGCERKSKFQKADYPILGAFYRRWCNVQNTDRIHSANGNTGLCFYWLSSFGAIYQHYTESNVIN
ncbi:hypothetical protein [Labilibaculum antarcticum]|uniref:hypothetical protein n=1 Tax=Labilibaculum antarcticum TaxID=1717717 RepID=UPI000BBAFDDB|nr:hypothetical protein [Labilibaculum antarcticum]